MCVPLNGQCSGFVHVRHATSSEVQIELSALGCVNLGPFGVHVQAAADEQRMEARPQRL